MQNTPNNSKKIKEYNWKTVKIVFNTFHFILVNFLVKNAPFNKIIWKKDNHNNDCHTFPVSQFSFIREISLVYFVRKISN